MRANPAAGRARGAAALELSEVMPSMSASSKMPAFPRDCANTACARPQYGPVAFCPYCGASSPVAAAPKASVAPAAGGVAVASPPAVAPSIPMANASEPRQVTVAGHQVERQPAPVHATPVVPVTAVAVARPGQHGRKLALVAAVLVALGGYGAYQMNARKALQQFEADLAAGQGCLRGNRFDCALENAERALGIDSKDPRAISLLQRAQAGLERQQREQDSKAQAAAAATAKAAAARQAAADQARRAKQAQELAERERQALEQSHKQALALQELLRDQAQMNRQQQQQREQHHQAQRQAAQQAPAVRPPPRPVAAASNPGLVGQQLSQARNALARRDGNAARVLANSVLRQDPSNRQAQNILRQAEQLRGQASFDRPKALGGVIIE